MVPLSQQRRVDEAGDRCQRTGEGVGAGGVGWGPTADPGSTREPLQACGARRVGGFPPPLGVCHRENVSRDRSVQAGLHSVIVCGRFDRGGGTRRDLGARGFHRARVLGRRETPRPCRPDWPPGGPLRHVGPDDAGLPPLLLATQGASDPQERVYTRGGGWCQRGSVRTSMARVIAARGSWPAARKRLRPCGCFESW